MRNIFKFCFILSLISLVILACGSGVRKAGPGTTPDRRTLAESGFDPLGEEGDEDVITADIPEARHTDSLKNILLFSQRNEAVKQADQFFSVQLFASKSNAEVKEFKNSILSLFDDEIRIDYQAPYYRVCVGKAAGFEQGEQLLKRVNAMGFPRAWLVKTRK